MAGRIEFWRDLLRRYSESGMTVVAFCEEQRVSTASFYNWRRRMNDDGRSPESVSEPPAFLPISVATETNSGCIEVLLPTEVTIRIPDGADRQTIFDVFSACRKTDS